MITGRAKERRSVKHVPEENTCTREDLYSMWRNLMHAEDT